MNMAVVSNKVIELLAPIGVSGTGDVDVRDDISPQSAYQLLRNARTTARNEERTARNEGANVVVSKEHWRYILEHAPVLLKEQSKDLEVVAWYIEALTREYGFQGLAEGFCLARQLLATYGEKLYPHADEDGLISQLSALVGLNGSGAEGALIYPIKMAFITEGDAPGPLAVWQCEQVLEADRISDVKKRDARFKTNGLTRAQLDQVIGETPSSFFQTVQQQIQLATAEYQAYCEILDDYCKDDPMPTGQIADTLSNCAKVLTYIAGDRLIATTAPVTDAQKSDTSEETTTKEESAMAGPINDREDALNRLREIAAFFRRAEPHSPISYSIEQAIRWSSLPLTDLIKELIPDDGARTKYQNLSGIGTSKPEK
jgi:type VI secretion system protein ImpA